MSSIIYCGTLLGSFVSGTQKYPLFSGCHLCTSFRMALLLQSHCQTIKLHTELSEMLVLPYSFVISLWHIEYQIDVGWISSDHLLDILLHSQCAVHFLERFIRPPAEVLQRSKSVRYKRGKQLALTSMLASLNNRSCPRHIVYHDVKIDPTLRNIALRASSHHTFRYLTFNDI